MGPDKPPRGPRRPAAARPQRRPASLPRGPGGRATPAAAQPPAAAVGGAAVAGSGQRTTGAWGQPWMRGGARPDPGEAGPLRPRATLHTMPANRPPDPPSGQEPSGRPAGCRSRPGLAPAPGPADAGPRPGDHPAVPRDRPAVYGRGSAGPGDPGAAPLNRSASTAAAMVRSKPVVSLMLEGGASSTRTGRPSRSNRAASSVTFQP